MGLNVQQADYLFEQMDLGKADIKDVAFMDIEKLKAEALYAREMRGEYENAQKQILSLKEKLLIAQNSTKVEDLQAECDELKEKVRNDEVKRLDREVKYQALEAELRNSLQKSNNAQKQFKKQLERDGKLTIKEFLLSFMAFAGLLTGYIFSYVNGNGLGVDFIIFIRLFFQILVKCIIIAGGGLAVGIFFRLISVIAGYGVNLVFGEKQTFRELWQERFSRIGGNVAFVFGVVGFLVIFRLVNFGGEPGSILYDEILGIPGNPSLAQTIEEIKQGLLEKGWMK